MSGVSRQVGGWMCDILDEAGLSAGDWLAGLDLGAAALRRPGPPLSWEAFGELCRRFERQFGSRRALLTAVRHCARRRFDEQGPHLPGGFTDQRQIYWLAHAWLLPDLLPEFRSEHEPLPDGRLRLRLEAPTGSAPPPLLFEVLQVLLMQAPSLVGQGPTRVDAELTPGRAVYVIVPSARAEADLRERENLYRRLTEHASDLIAEIDDAGVITYASPNTLEILGRESSELLGRCSFELLHENEGRDDPRRVSERLRDPRPNSHFRIRHRDGSWRWFDVSLRRIEWPGAAPRFILVARDITEQRRAERRSEDWRMRYQAMIRVSDQIVYDWDLRSGKVEFHGSESLFGRPPENADENPREYLRNLTPEDRQRVLKELARAIRDKDSFHVEFATRGRDGQDLTVENRGYFLFDDDGEIRRMIGFITDVTRRRRGERAVREQGELLARIANTVPDILYVFDVENWRISFMNDAVERVLGYPQDRFTDAGARFIGEILHPVDRKAFTEYRSRVETLPDSGDVRVSFRLRHANGQWRWLNLRNRVLSRHPDGRVREILGTASDFTEHKQAREALRTSEERYRIVSELTSDYAFAVRVHADQTLEREWITEAFTRITGYAPDEMQEEQWTTLVHPEDHEKRRQQFIDAITHGQATHEYRIFRKTGELRVIREHARVIANDDGSFHWYGACRDITDQTLAEAERALSEERFNAITESSHDIILEVDDAGRTLYVSPNVEELLGYSEREIREDVRSDLVHPDDLAMLLERTQKMLQGNTSDDLLYRVRTAQGDWRWINVAATAFETGGGERRLVMVCRDITDRLEIEEERSRLVSVVENSSEFIAMIGADGRILFMNEGGQRLVGFASDEDARDHTLFDCLAPEDSQDVRFRVFPAALRGERWEGDFRLRHRETGNRIATLAHLFRVAGPRSADPGVLAIVARDVTERITSERLLRESEARHRMLVESTYDLIAEFDGLGRYVYASPNYERQLGYAPGSLLGSAWIQQIHPHERDAARDALADLGSGATRACPPLRLRHHDGRWIWVETNLKRYENFRGESLVLAFSRDISRRKSAEEALERSRQELLQSQKMEAVGRLAGGVAHDFNNLLTAIIGYSDLLLESATETPTVRADAEEIIRAANRAAELTRQLLAFSRRQVLVPKVLDLNRLVGDVDRLLRRLIGEDVELRTRLDAVHGRVKLDPGQLEQLVINLAVNARDAMPQGGYLEIATANLDVADGGNTDHPGIRPGRFVTLRVSDTGIGMDATTRSKIFEPFFTTKGAAQGTGLGLATVYGIIQQSGGEIRVDSEPGRGSTFTIYLPRVDEEIDPVEVADEPRAEGGGGTILLVEDSETVRNLVKRYLEKHGFTVLAAESGDSALRIAGGLDGTIELLLTDVVLPRMDGHALAQRLRAERPETRVLYMSGFSDDALARHGIDARDIALLPKPFAPAALLREVRRILGEPAPADG